MIDVTDRHCRYFHRQLAPTARLYTEMVTTGALLYGQASRHLDFDPAEHPVALQLGGSDPYDLARAARLGAQWGYDEINLNCGCPSDRVQQGAFGACLMAEPLKVADCVRAMQDATSLPVTVKHRLGLDHEESYDFVRDFVGILYEAGCRVFIVHARNAILRGLSPRENRQIPPLRPQYAHRLKADFPDAVIVLNGGLADVASCLHWLEQLDGVMLGRAAWHHPDVLSQLHQALEPHSPLPAREEILETLLPYLARHHAQGVPMPILVRGLLGWHAGTKGARKWRRMLSDPAILNRLGPQAVRHAWRALQPGLMARAGGLASSAGQSRM
ncbi:tRNA dihydrouridine(20/20a) synthase DusA [Castellaniella sp.]|uniref:tRNA dihydrouridine(20/20a) synthase DusA n=1 Tax=Castellaniella sp. TaxID=1955812 RepID=UPI00356162BC